MAKRRDHQAIYQRRLARAAQFDITYSQQRRLKQLFPLSQKSLEELKHNNRNVSAMHTEYAIIRVHLAQQDREEGKRLSPKKKRALKVLDERPGLTPPIAELMRWYRRAWGRDFVAADFPVFVPQNIDTARRTVQGQLQEMDNAYIQQELEQGRTRYEGSGWVEEERDLPGYYGPTHEDDFFFEQDVPEWEEWEFEGHYLTP